MNSQLLTQPDIRSIFAVVERLLPEIAPLKVTTPICPETSLSQDLDFDSLDVVSLLAGINLHFSIEIDFEEWLFRESQRDDPRHTVESLCRLIIDSLPETHDALYHVITSRKECVR